MRVRLELYFSGPLRNTELFCQIEWEDDWDHGSVPSDINSVYS